MDGISGSGDNAAWHDHCSCKDKVRVSILFVFDGENYDEIALGT